MILHKNCFSDGCIDIRPNISRIILRDVAETSDRYYHKLLSVLTVF